jgi:thymidylate kinase
MQFIFCGNECTFKTTLVNKLVENQPHLHVVRGSSFESARQSHEALLKWYKDTFSTSHAVFDRAMYSNYVYTRAFRDGTLNRLALDEIHEMEEFILEWHGPTVVVWLVADPATIRDRLLVRGDRDVPPDINTIEDINQLYNSVMSIARLPVLKLDTTILSSDDILNRYLIPMMK